MPRRLGPKRATRIRKLFALDKADKMEKQYRVKREVSRGEGKKPTIKMPKIQRLVTPQRLQVCQPSSLCFPVSTRRHTSMVVYTRRAIRHTTRLLKVNAIRIYPTFERYTAFL